MIQSLNLKINSIWGLINWIYLSNLLICFSIDWNSNKFLKILQDISNLISNHMHFYHIFLNNNANTILVSISLEIRINLLHWYIFKYKYNQLFIIYGMIKANLLIFYNFILQFDWKLYLRIFNLYVFT